MSTNKTLPFFNTMTAMPKKAAEGISLDGIYNIFGNWDFAIWFEADSNESAVHFVGEKIRSIEGVLDTHTLPATAIKEYM